MLYIPVMGANEIWRIALDGGAPETVAGDLGVPDAVKFDARGHIVSTQVGSGQVVRIDPRTGERAVLADIAPGLDNLDFVGERLFVSSISGQVNEILANGEVRSLVPDGFNWPLGLAMGADGALLVADGGFVYRLEPGGTPQALGMFFTPGFPGYTRGVAAAGPGEYLITSANGHVARWWPARQESEFLAEGFDQLYGIALTTGGAAVFAEKGTGRVLCIETGGPVELAAGLDGPSGVAMHGDACLVAEEGAGRVVKLARGGAVEVVVDGLAAPQGLLVTGDLLYVIDAGMKALVECDLASGARRTLVTDLPVGAPPGVVPKFLGPIGVLSGPMGPFADLTAGTDGALYLSADAEGSVLALRPAAGRA
jgi:sugar lactone lactonase YvrE